MDEDPIYRLAARRAETGVTPKGGRSRESKGSAGVGVVAERGRGESDEAEPGG